MRHEQKAVDAIIEAIPLEVRTSGKVSVITEGVMDCMRLLAPAVIFKIVSRHGVAEPIRRLRVVE
ncbi:MAG: hypothetical protein FJZ01_00900 [Candidatus Sericytochromatia bacterium]|nr:hypothetical protein [Candidatus Tanganyikabacteria bacterium]